MTIKIKHVNVNIMLTAEALRTGIEEFQLNVNGIEVMPVYWIIAPDYSDAFKGAKGTPEAMQSEVDRVLARCAEVSEEVNVRTVNGARNFLYRNQIATDCSGFGFNLLDRVTESEGLGSYADTIFVPRKAIIEASVKESWRVEHELTPDEIADLPTQVPLKWVSETFNKDLASQVNVVRLCNDAASIAVSHLCEVQPGDLIAMSKNGKSKHVAVIVEADDDLIEIWDSYRDDESYGGIMSHEIQIRDTNLPIESQTWTQFDTGRYDSFAIRRPKALTN